MDVQEDEKSVAEITFLALFVVLEAIVGFFLHIKIIKAAKKEQEVTCTLDVTNSCVLMVHYLNMLITYNLYGNIKNFYMYTGEWFCYVSKVAVYYGTVYITTHSLVVSVMKYFIIVRWQEVENYGREKVILFFFWVNIVHPAFTIALHLIIRPDFFWAYDGFAQIDKCLGEVYQETTKNNSYHKVLTLDFCDDFFETDSESYFWDLIALVRTIACGVQITFLYLSVWNVFEIFFYFLIFQFLKRHFKEEEENQKQENDVHDLNHSVNHNTNELNMKRLKVNAQVTAFSCILELVGNVTFVIHILITGGPSFSSFVHGQILYMLVLPYAFLMNTSNNKNRIVEHGWINVLQNVCGRFKWTETDRNAGSEPVAMIKKHRCKKSTKTDNSEKDLVSVSTILTKCQQVQNENSNFLTLHTPVYNDSTPEQIGKIRKKQTTSKGVVISPNELRKANNNQLVVQNILYFMTENIKNEELYIKFFKKLLDFEDLHRDQRSFSQYEAQDKVINCDNAITEFNGGKDISKKPKQKSFLLKQRNDDSKAVPQHDKAITNISPSTNISQNTENRSILRMNIVKQLSCLHHQDDLYKTLLENLIDLEEGFLNND